MTLGLGLALVPPTPMPLLQPTEVARGVATVVAGLLLLRVGAFPRGRTYVVQHLLVALVTAWGVVVFASAQNWVAMALMVITTTTLVALPFAAPASSLTRGDGTTAPHLLALALGGIAAAWGGLHLLDDQGTTAMLRGYGLDPEPYWWLAAATGFEVVAQELLPVPVRWRWAAQIACGAVCLSYALMLPLRVPSAYWLLNAATIVRSVALLALPVLRGRTLLETSAYADRLTTALILAAVSPLAIVVTSVMWLIDDSAVAAAERNAILGATLLAAAVFSLAARVQAGALTGELRAFSQRIASSAVGRRGPFVGPGEGRELRQVAERLEEVLDQLDERAQERQALLQRLRTQNAALAEANAAKDEFLNLVSHELRTPLTIITANARLLSERGSRLPRIEVDAALLDVSEAGDRLEGIVDDLLTLARPEQGLGLEVQPLRVVPVVREAAAVHRRLHPTRAVEVSAEAEQLLGEADPSALVAVLMNLLSNAEKYSPSAAPIDIEVCRFGPHVRITVGDRGVGIAAVEAARLFEPFYRGREVSEAAPGLGVGLAVSRKLMLAMGGAIAGQPRLGGGAEFELLLRVPEAMTVD